MTHNYLFLFLLSTAQSGHTSQVCHTLWLKSAWARCVLLSVSTP